MIQILKEQYQFIISSREVLLSYCETFSEKDFFNKQEGFGNASIHYLLLHNVNCYRFWIGSQALRKDIAFLNYDEKFSLTQIRTFFNEIDKLMDKFLNANLSEKITFQIRSTSNGITSPLQLFTHVTTHEFHHKGQILSMSRHLGYTPVDTDVMRQS